MRKRYLRKYKKKIGYLCEQVGKISREVLEEKLHEAYYQGRKDSFRLEVNIEMKALECLDKNNSKTPVSNK